MEPFALLQNTKERYHLSFFISALFILNLLIEYNSYKKFINEEVFRSDAVILNIYKKESSQILKLQSGDFITFTSVSLDMDIKKLDRVNIFLITKGVGFLDYLKGFYTKSFNIRKVPYKKDFKDNIYDFLNYQHEDITIGSIYTALFMAVPIESGLRDIFASYGISHLIAISGFHLGLISIFFYFSFNFLYSPLHKRFFPYRNKRFDILIGVSFILFSYLLFTNTAPSLLRAFSMFVIGLFLLRNNIKLLSFNTLFIAIVFIIALFPKLLFSLSLWFSAAGVFYIYLFIKYFKALNKYVGLVLFNIWIYLAINPVVHFFFGATALEQLYSPALTLLFTIFYPLSVLLHLFGFGGFFDQYIIEILKIDIVSFEVFTPLWFFVLYLVVSFASIIDKKAFYLLHFLFISFNLYLYL